MTSTSPLQRPKFAATAKESAVERVLLRDVGRAVAEFSLIQDGDRIMVAMSGGKDSYSLYTLLERMRRRAPIRFELVAVHLDQGHPGYDGTPLESWLRAQQATYHILREDTFTVIARTEASLRARRIRTTIRAWTSADAPNPATKAARTGARPWTRDTLRSYHGSEATKCPAGHIRLRPLL